MEKWKTIKSEPLVDSRWVKVRKDSVDLPNGQHIDDFYAISLNDAAAIVALDDYPAKGTFLFVNSLFE